MKLNLIWSKKKSLGKNQKTKIKEKNAYRLDTVVFEDAKNGHIKLFTNFQFIVTTRKRKWRKINGF